MSSRVSRGGNCCNPCGGVSVQPPPTSVKDVTVVQDPDQSGVTGGVRLLFTATLTDGTTSTSKVVVPTGPTVTGITVTLAQ